ncbi:MAG: hypothetical protein O2U61_05865 [Candidatus Bathyarchaeota archaeon]|nr:hypothetical protein [Candidatus Bathyarchaeota archaeon]
MYPLLIFSERYNPRVYDQLFDKLLIEEVAERSKRIKIGVEAKIAPPPTELKIPRKTPNRKIKKLINAICARLDSNQ